MIESVFQAVKDAIMWVFQQIIDFFVYLVDITLNLIVALFPSFNAPLDALLAIMTNVNFILPIGYGMTLFFAYYSIKPTMIIIRWVLKFIPTIG